MILIDQPYLGPEQAQTGDKWRWNGCKHRRSLDRKLPAGHEAKRKSKRKSQRKARRARP